MYKTDSELGQRVHEYLLQKGVETPMLESKDHKHEAVKMKWMRYMWQFMI